MRSVERMKPSSAIESFLLEDTALFERFLILAAAASRAGVRAAMIAGMCGGRVAMRCVSFEVSLLWTRRGRTDMIVSR